MSVRSSLALIILLAAAAPARTSAEPAPPPIAHALEAVGITESEFRLDPLDLGLYGGDQWRLRFFDALVQRPLRIPGDVEVYQRNILLAADRPSNLFTFATARIETSVRRGLVGDPLAAIRARLPKRAPLAAAVRDLWKTAGRPLPPEDRDRIEAASRALTDSLAVSLAIIVQAGADAIRARDAALAPLRPAMDDRALRRLERDAVTYVVGSDAGNLDAAFLRRVEDAAGAVDFSLWNAGIADLLLAIESQLPRLREMTPRAARAWRIDTPFGPILLASAGDDRHPGPDPFLLIDPAGNDRYEAAGGAGYDHPIAISLDFAGDDIYATTDTLSASFGAGILGTGILIDEAGNDRYRGGHVSLGAGLIGTGVLVDRAGTDTYDALTAAQGAGLFGAGILADLQGNDTYHAFQQVQGYGYVKGVGIFVDRAGDDRYVADDTTIRFPSAQSKEHNSSLAQGFGFGKRSDFVDGRSLAGGIGILVDGDGNDAYRCGVFGQGCGYWYGTGILADAGGNDTYDGIWYVQGSGAHFALGILREGGGNDSYSATMNMAQGAGHDFSLGFLYDQAGNDRYAAPNLSLGGGNANGIGFFWDLAGDDQYSVEAATTLGLANTASRGGIRDRIVSLGLFVDTGGRDSYPVAKGFAGNGRLWTQPGTDREHPLASEKGAGVDTTWTP